MTTDADPRLAPMKPPRSYNDPLGGTKERRTQSGDEAI